MLGAEEDGPEPKGAQGTLGLEFEDPGTTLQQSLAEKTWAEAGNLHQSGGIVGLGQARASSLQAEKGGMAQGMGAAALDLGTVSQGVAEAGRLLLLLATFHRGQGRHRVDFFFAKPGFHLLLGESLEHFGEERGQHRGKEAGREGASEKPAGLEIEEGDLSILEKAEVVAVEVGMVDAFCGQVQGGAQEAAAGGRVEGLALREGGGEEDGAFGAQGAADTALGQDAGDQDATGCSAGEVLCLPGAGRRAQGIAQPDAEEGEEVLLGVEDALFGLDAEDAAEDAFGDEFGPRGERTAEELGFQLAHLRLAHGAWGAWGRRRS